MRGSAVAVALALLLLCGCSQRPVPQHAPPHAVPPHPAPLHVEARAATITESTPTPTVPPETLYEPGFDSLHAGYLETIARANGKPLAHDAPILAGNAIQHHGNSYTVASVSLLILGDAPRVTDNEFDPHAAPAPVPRAATPEETARAEQSATTAAPVIHLDHAQLLITAPLPMDTARCTPCHAPGSAPRAALLYTLRELADD